MRINLGNSVTSSSVITFMLQEFQKKREKKRGVRKFEEVRAENFPNLGRERHPDIEGQRTPIKINKRKPAPRHF